MTTPVRAWLISRAEGREPFASTFNKQEMEFYRDNGAFCRELSYHDEVFGVKPTSYESTVRRFHAIYPRALRAEFGSTVVFDFNLEPLDNIVTQGLFNQAGLFLGRMYCVESRSPARGASDNVYLQLRGIREIVDATYFSLVIP